MNVKIRELLQLQSLQGFQLVAGKKGLHREVASVGVLDYEFTDVSYGREDVFARDSFVISSLLFAKDHPELLPDAIRRLIGYGVSGFAYKSLIYRELPKEALDLANHHKFPIFRFEDPAYFENIIYEIMTRVVQDDTQMLMEKQIDRMLFQELEPDELLSVCGSFFLSPAEHCTAYFIRTADGAALSFGSLYNSFLRSGYRRENTALCRYRDFIVLLITLDYEQPSSFRVVLEEWLETCRINGAKVFVSHSAVHPARSHLHTCIREAYAAGIANKIQCSRQLSYEDIGIYRLLVPLRHNATVQSYMQEYLQPLLEQEELLQTAIEYVKANGDVEQTAQRLFCHQNTVRYRVKKLRSALPPSRTDSAFYESLAIAVKIYLLNQASHS